ncbi:MAG: hypothetical protein N3C63_05760 [Rhodocyclaceae bacterium]|nr:hypothetical protein [Rhodocyclaceae bacterium]
MIALTLRLKPLTAFATPLIGDTLFGQLCWAIRHGWGEARLRALLAGYLEDRPFLVVSDAFPAGFVPLPHLPARFWQGASDDPKARKALKKVAWVAHELLPQPLPEWQRLAKERRPASADPCARMQPRNSLNRLTLCTAEGEGFSPYSVRQRWYGDGAQLEVHLRLDETRLTRDELHQAFVALGAMGFGKDANVGLGKFAVEALSPSPLAGQPEANAWLALAPCAPQGCGFDAAKSFYKPFTRYGRHGDYAARLGNAFKTPLLLAAAGAVFAAPPDEDFARGYIGQGLGGEKRLSKVLSGTVHQGYAPALPIRLPEEWA